MSGTPFDFDPDELEDFVQEYLELDRRVQRPQGIYSILPGAREAQYQHTLKYLLHPRKSHGFRYSLLEQFLACIDFHEFNLPGQHIEIDDEVGIRDDGTAGRIDLVICGGRVLEDHPEWAVFVELKVGAPEGTEQTRTYANADTWNFDWFDSNHIDVEALAEKKYVYVKRDAADPPDDRTGTFESISWSEIAEQFENGTRDSLFQYPSRSVVHLTDFIRSLKEAEGMDAPIDEDELNERLRLYFEHSDLIQQVQQANSQFESDFEDISTYLQNSWVNELGKKYDFEDTGWKTSTSSSAKWEKILPDYWDQEPLDRRSTIQLYYRHSPTVNLLRKQVLRFRLRLPPQRNVHTEPFHDDQSFNEVFTTKCTGEYRDRIERSLAEIDVDDIRLDGASALVIKNYQLDPHNLTESYFDQLDTAVSEFCSGRTELSRTINEVFEETYRTVFDEKPVSDFPGSLPEKE